MVLVLITIVVRSWTIKQEVVQIDFCPSVYYHHFAGCVFLSKVSKRNLHSLLGFYLYSLSPYLSCFFKVLFKIWVWHEMDFLNFFLCLLRSFWKWCPHLLFWWQFKESHHSWRSCGPITRKWKVGGRNERYLGGEIKTNRIHQTSKRGCVCWNGCCYQRGWWKCGIFLS